MQHSNKFLLLHNENNQDQINKLLEDIAHLSSSKDNTQNEVDKKNIYYKVIHTTLKIEVNTTIENIMQRIEEGFEKILL